MLIRPVTASLSTILFAVLIGGCATEHLGAAPPAGVDLSGEWRLNVDLSDDPEKVMEQQSEGNQQYRHHGHDRGGQGTGLPPFGIPGGHSSGSWPDTGDDLVGGSSDSASNQDWGLGRSDISSMRLGDSPSPSGSSGSSSNTPSSAHGRRSAGGRWMLQAPDRLSIAQSGTRLTIKAAMSDGATDTEDYTAGAKSTVPFGRDTAERSVGWRGQAFVVSTKAQKGPSREEEYALDLDGRLIVTTQLKGGRSGKMEIKRVYDRVRA
jgi:hypothetical protein